MSTTNLGKSASVDTLYSTDEIIATKYLSRTKYQGSVQYPTTNFAIPYESDIYRYVIYPGFASLNNGALGYGDYFLDDLPLNFMNTNAIKTTVNILQAPVVMTQNINYIPYPLTTISSCISIYVSNLGIGDYLFEVIFEIIPEFS